MIEVSLLYSARVCAKDRLRPKNESHIHIVCIYLSSLFSVLFLRDTAVEFGSSYFQYFHTFTLCLICQSKTSRLVDVCNCGQSGGESDEQMNLCN